MRLGLTNLAWDPSQDEAVAGLLARLGVDAIDVAPSKYFADVSAVREAEVRQVRDWWSDRGIEITGMQSLLYGTQGLRTCSARRTFNSGCWRIWPRCAGWGLGWGQRGWCSGRRPIATGRG